jgi:hypothetical protein
MDAVTAIHASVAIVAVGVLFTSVETIWLLLRGAYSENGIWPWFIVRECYPAVTSRVLSLFASTAALTAVVCGRIISVAILLCDYSAGRGALFPLGFVARWPRSIVLSEWHQ